MRNVFPQITSGDALSEHYQQLLFSMACLYAVSTDANAQMSPEAVEDSFEEAMQWYNAGFYARAVQAFDAFAKIDNSPTAAYNLYVCWRDGLGDARDRYSEEEAVLLLSFAANEGLVVAQHEFGRRLCQGAGADKDEAAGIEWIRRAAADVVDEDPLKCRQGFKPAKDYLEQHGL